MLRLILEFIESFLTVVIAGVTGYAGTTFKNPPVLAWLIFSAGGVLAGVRRVNALMADSPKKES